MQAEEVQLRSTEITGYVIKETCLGYCLDWLDLGATTLGKMGFRTCVIECFRVLAYYRARKMIPELTLFSHPAYRFSPLGSSPFFSQFYLHC